VLEPAAQGLDLGAQVAVVQQQLTQRGGGLDHLAPAVPLDLLLAVQPPAQRRVLGVAGGRLLVDNLATFPDANLDLPGASSLA
jgi:hypothetical protein